MAEGTISLRGVRVHNLRGLDIDIPLGKLTLVTGVSGAGKSSLVFDTIYAEAQRRYLQSFSAYTRQFLERYDRPEAEHIGDLPPAVAVRPDAMSRHARATVGTVTEVIGLVRLLMARFGVVTCINCGSEVRPQNTADVLAAAASLAAGTRFTVAFPLPPSATGEVESVVQSLREEGFLRVQVGEKVYRLDQDDLVAPGEGEAAWVLVDRLEAGKATLERVNDAIETAFQRGGGRMALLTEQAPRLFDRRLVCPHCDIAYPEPRPELLDFAHPLGACPGCHGTGTAPSKGRTAVEGETGVCTVCRGTRLNDAAQSLRWNGRTIADLAAQSVAELRLLFQQAATFSAAEPLVRQVRDRLGFLDDVRLGYLTLDRPAPTLAVSEARRLVLAAAASAPLVNALYLVEEPLAGAHVTEVGPILDKLRGLCAAGNTVVAIEHNLAALARADYVVDLGPGAGEEGGRLVFQGAPSALAECPESVTAEFLRGAEEPGPRRRPATGPRLRLRGARLHNLRNLTVEFPLGVLCVVTGVSGAGKSSLVEDTLYPTLCRARKKQGCPPASEGAEVSGAGQIGDVLLMDQAPLPRTARSIVATYLKIFDDIRDLFAQTTEARIRNFGPGAFSFNQEGGRCEACAGQGTLAVPMQFLADVVMTCPECQGARFRKEILNAKVRNLSIAEVLDLTVREAFRFFRAQARIERKLKVLLDVGLDYLRLGQPIETLSGGEAQRLKLAAHLSASRKPHCLFLLIEPTIGLHPADVEQLVSCFHRLLDAGHSLIVVEQHLHVLRSADYLIELGPGGAAGGCVVAAGTPEEVAGVAESLTGKALLWTPGVDVPKMKN